MNPHEGLIDGDSLVDGRGLVDGRSLSDGLETKLASAKSHISDGYGENLYNALKALVQNGYMDGIYNIFVSKRELGKQSDADVMIVFKDKETLDEISKALQVKATSAPDSILGILQKYEKEKTEFWLYHKGNYRWSGKQVPFQNFECGTPLKETTADWGPLARYWQLRWQQENGRTIYCDGEFIENKGESKNTGIPGLLNEKKKDIESQITPEEAYEYLIVQTRKLAEGVFRITDPSKHALLHPGENYDDYIRQKDLQLSKAILRAASAYNILFSNKNETATANFKEMSKQARGIFRVAPLTPESEGLVIEARNVRYMKKTKHFTLGEKKINEIYDFFNSIIDSSKQAMNDQFDYIYNSERLERIGKYYDRNTEALAERLNEAKLYDNDFEKKSSLLFFYLDGLLSYVQKTDKLSANTKDVLEKIPSSKILGSAYRGTYALDGKRKFVLAKYAGKTAPVKTQLYAEAKEALNEALKETAEDEVLTIGFMWIDPRLATAEIYKNLGKIEIEQLNPSNKIEVENYFKQALERNPKDPETWEGLAKVTGDNDYQIIADAIKNNFNVPLDFLTQKHQEFFKQWRKHLTQKIELDIATTKHGLEDFFLDYESDKKSFDEKPESEKNFDNAFLERAKLFEKEIRSCKNLLTFQKRMREQVGKVPVELFYTLEKSYFDEKRNFRNELHTLSNKLSELFTGEAREDEGDKGTYELLKNRDLTESVELPLAGTGGCFLGETISLAFSKTIPYINTVLPKIWQINPAQYLNDVYVGGTAAALALLALASGRFILDKQARTRLALRLGINLSENKHEKEA
jgi:hypothetical protein